MAIEELIQELWFSKRYIGVKLTEETVEKLKKQTQQNETTAFIDRQVIFQAINHKFKTDNKNKPSYFVEISIVNNKVIVVAVEQSGSAAKQKQLKPVPTLVYTLWKK